MTLSYLDEARNNGRADAAARGLLVSGGNGGGQARGILVRFADLEVSADAPTTITEVRRAEVTVDGATVWLPADPGTYIVGGPVVVLVDGNRRPTRVTGPASSPATVNGEEAQTVTHMPDLVQDEAARLASAAAGVAAAAAQAGLIDLKDNALPQVEANVEAVADFLAEVRANTGTRRWVGGPFDTPHFTWQPLGGGKVRFKGKHVGNTFFAWTFPGGTPGTASTEQVEVTFPTAGARTITYNTSGPAGGINTSAPITLTPEMMAADYDGWVDVEWPEVDWSQADIALDQLSAPGGPLAPDVLAALYQDVVVAGISLATEAFIGGNAFLENAVEAKHIKASESMSARLAEFLEVTAEMMNVVTTLPDGAKLSILPDGMRIWRAGNTGSSPNVALTVGDGFRIQRNDGTGLLWIDPATGDLHTAGSVVSGGQIIGASFIGGSISIQTPAGVPVLTASPLGGVTIGGREVLHSTVVPVNVYDASYNMTPVLPTVAGQVYGLTLRLGRSAGYLSYENWIEAVFSNGTRDLSSRGWLSLYGETRIVETSFVAPPGATSVRIRFRRGQEVAPTAYVTLSDVVLSALAPGNITVGGIVTAERGILGRLEVASIQGTQGIAWDPTDTGWLPFDLQGNWTSITQPQRRKQGSRVWLRGEIICTNVAAGPSRPITNLPEGWRPPRRTRFPWGWGGTLTAIEVGSDGAVWSMESVRTASPGMGLDVVSFDTTSPHPA